MAIGTTHTYPNKMGQPFTVTQETGRLVLRTRSPFSGKKHSIVLQDWDLALFARRYASWGQGALIQNAFHDLTPSQREFLMTGIPDEEFPTSDEPTEDTEDYGKSSDDEPAF